VTVRSDDDGDGDDDDDDDSRFVLDQHVLVGFYKC
jgi:hypothetical protein